MNATRVAIVAALVVGCGVDDGGPRLASVTPSAAGHNTPVVISGSRLCGDSGDCSTAAGQVQIGLASPAVKAPILDYSDTSATITIPDLVPAGRTEIVITVNERASNALAFEVLQ